MKNFIIYTISTGRIDRAVAADIEILDQTFIELIYPEFDPILQDFLETDDLCSPLSWYFDGVEPIERPVFSDTWNFNKSSILPDGIDSATIGPGLPNPTKCYIATPEDVEHIEPFDLVDGQLSFTAPSVGTYIITLSAFPYVDEQFTIECAP